MAAEYGEEAEDFDAEEGEAEDVGGAGEAGCEHGGGHEGGVGGERGWESAWLCQPMAVDEDAEIAHVGRKERGKT